MLQTNDRSGDPLLVITGEVAGMNKSQLYLEALRAPPHAPPHAPAGAGPPSISEGALTANFRPPDIADFHD
jgi:hypothetical protein